MNKIVLRKLNHVIISLIIMFSVNACGIIERQTVNVAGDKTPPQTEVKEVAGAQGVLNQARKAKNAGDLARAERLYISASSMQDLAANEKIAVWRELAEVSYVNAHHNMALSALDSWQRLEPKADASAAWQNLWYAIVTTMNITESRVQAKRAYENQNLSLSTRSLAGVVYSGRLLRAGLQEDAIKILEDIGNNPSIATYKAQLEHRLYAEIKALDDIKQAELITHITSANETTFPYTIFLYQVAYTQTLRSETPEDQANASSILERLKKLGVLTGPPPSAVPSLVASSGAQTLGQAQGHGVALVLPMTGALGNMGMKIAYGAKIAQTEAAASGASFGLHIIDSDLAGWEAELKKLPPDVRIIGGPLMPRLYNSIKSQGITSEKVLFTFLQNIEAGDEGRVAWRFFASPEDQAKALLNFTDALGINTFASYAPDDTYGTRMTATFENAVRQKNLYMSTSGSYPSGAAQEWNKSVGSFLNTSKNSTSAPSGSYKAIFLPDTWKSMEIIIPTMFYYRESRQVLLGTSLWEQGILSSGKIDSRYYDLAVFPSPWLDKVANNISASNASTRLDSSLRSNAQIPDLWYSLGYDFSRLASSLDIKAGWTAAQVNVELAKAKSFDWTMAPIQWNYNGVASQELFLFTPIETGFAPVNLELMKQRFAKVWGSSYVAPNYNPAK